MPEVGPVSMASDGRVFELPLRKHACRACGLVATLDDADRFATLFEHGYQLNAHPPRGIDQRARDGQYAEWIHRCLSTHAHPRVVLDVGCGNGSLLHALGEQWRSAIVKGCDPSAEAVAHARASGLDVWQGSAAALPSGLQADLVVSVNVIEHTLDPVRFLRDLRAALAPGGRLALICPDGCTPGVELLIADHRFSFTPRHLRVLLGRAGLEVDAIDQAPTAIGAFQMAICRAGAAATHTGAEEASRVVPKKEDYLRRWAELDRALEARLDGPAVSFGIGEAACLLRAYTPRVWRHIRACTADRIGETAVFGALPVISLDALAPEETVVLAVRPQDQPRVADRLRARFAHVIVWHDLVEARAAL